MKSEHSKLNKNKFKIFITVVAIAVSMGFEGTAHSKNITTSDELSLRGVQIGMSIEQVRGIIGKKCTPPEYTINSRLRIDGFGSGTDGLDFAVLGEKYMSCDGIQILDRVTRRFFLFFEYDELDYVWISQFQKGHGGRQDFNHPPEYFEALGEKYNVKPIYEIIRPDNSKANITLKSTLLKVSSRIEGKYGDWLRMSGEPDVDKNGKIVGYDTTILEFGVADYYDIVSERIKNIRDEQEALKRKKELQNKSKL